MLRLQWLYRCVIEYLQRNVKKRLGWEPKHVLHRKNDIVQECGVQVRLACLPLPGGAGSVT